MSEKTQAELDWEALQIVLARAAKANPRYPDAVRAAAIPHWFDAEILAALLGEDADAPTLFAWLAQRPFVERYGERAYALHERTRDVLRARLWADNPARMREWSARAAEFFRKQLGEKALVAQSLGPRAAGLTRGEEELYAEVIYHWFAVDDTAAFRLFRQALQDAQLEGRLTLRDSLQESALEQSRMLGDSRDLVRSYKDWLHAIGFKEDPFENLNAAIEEHLQECFVEPYSFSDILGSATNPESCILFAPRGGGKTAIRVMVDHWCKIGERVGGRVFVIRYDRDCMKRVYENSQGVPITGHAHIVEILHTVTPDVFHYLLSHAELYASIDALTKKFLRWLVKEYLDDSRLEQVLLKCGLLETVNARSLTKLLKSRLERERTKGSLPPHKQLPFDVFCDVLGGRVLDLRVNKMMPSDLMGKFARLVRAMQMTATYVLVDGVDEFAPLDKDPNLEGQFLSPLLELMLLEMEKQNVAFKFFFPNSLELFVKKYIREDRVGVYRVNWTDTQLMEILHRRLSTFSEGRLSSLAAISEVDIRSTVDMEIVKCAQGNPRWLLRMGEGLFRVHAARALGTRDLLISRADFEKIRQEQEEVTHGSNPNL